MKHTFTKFLSLAALFSCAAIIADDCDTSCNTSGDCPTTSCYPNRSQSAYKMRQVSGMRGHSHDIQQDMDDSFWGSLSLTPGYHQTFKSKEIASCLFGGDVTCSDGCQQIVIQGSSVEDRNENAWLADYFYLPTDFEGSFKIDPKIKNFILDFDLYLGLDSWLDGAYMRVHAPLVHTRWDLNYGETISEAGTNDHPAHYFTPALGSIVTIEDGTADYARSNLLDNFSQFAAGKAPDNLIGIADQGDDSGPGLHNVIFQKLRYAQFGCESYKKTGFADIRTELGWNFISKDDYHLGLAVTTAIPTGNACCTKNLFDAVVGNGNHWELGGVLSGHYVFWRSQDEDKHAGIYLDANITHMFETNQLRTFDLKNKPNSKYMLATKFGQNIKGIQSRPSNILAKKSFIEEYAPVANISTVRVDVSSSIQADIVAWFNFTTEKFSWDLGYNFYARGCEDIDCKPECGPCATRDNIVNSPDTWALKGDSAMYGIALSDNVSPLIGDDQSVPLSATQSEATIHTGQNGGQAQITISSNNNNIDNAELAEGTDGTNTTDITSFLVDINTSIQPIFLNKDDINFGGTKSISHALFTHFNYNLEERDDYRPYVGIGAMVEWGTTSDCCSTSNNNCDSCTKCAPSYWGVWLKGGVSFE